MSKLTLTRIDNINTAVADINANFGRIETAFDNTLSRDGTAPNAMEAPLDLNSRKILNLPIASGVGEAVAFQQAASITGGSVSTFGVMLQDFGVRTAEEAGWSADFTANMQNALDYMGLHATGRRGTLLAPTGHYRMEGRLNARNNTHIQGELHDNGTVFNFYGKDNNEALLLDGANGNSNWLHHFSMSRIRLELNAFTGTTLNLFKIRQAYSCSFDEITLGSVTSTYTPLLIGYVNDVCFTKLVVGGVSSDVITGASVLIDSSAGPVNKLKFIDPDIEVATTGFKLQGSQRLIAEINGMYTEQLNTNVYWDSSSSESYLLVSGGEINGKNGATGVDIRRSNCSVIGLCMVNAGLRGVDIDNATTHANCHVIGGHYNVTTKVRDTNNWLVTNSFA